MPFSSMTEFAYGASPASCKALLMTRCLACYNMSADKIVSGLYIKLCFTDPEALETF